MSGERSKRTIYRSSGAPAAARPGRRTGRRAGTGAGAPARSRRHLRDAWWPAPLLALAIVVAIVVLAGFFVLGGSGLLQSAGISTGGHEYQGTWGAAGTTLGGKLVRITRQGGNRYTIDGVRLPDLGGASSLEAQVKDDSLVASAASGASWRLSLTFINGDQLRASVTFGDGRPSREIVLTKR
jgi:hypothetical protein